MDKDKNKIVADCLREIKAELRATRSMLEARYSSDEVEEVMQEVYKQLRKIKEGN